MSFTNRIRLPLQLHSPQYPQERSVFRKANGETKTMSVIVRKNYELETDYMPDNWHQRLIIALSHDNITLEGERYLGGVSQDGDYNIEWPEGVMHYPTAKAGVKVQVTPFDATNANCQTCEQASQLDLENDQATGIYGALQEDQDYTVSTADNDSICCYPAVFSLISYNSDYLTSASIDPVTGILSIHTGTGLISANGIVIATYRVTCADGSYDEADVTADIEGSIEGCLAPESLILTGTAPDEITVSWVEADPGSDYYWEIYEGSLPAGSPVQTGSVTGTGVVITGLGPNTQYYIQVRTVCYGSESNFIGDSVYTPTESPEEQCGSYEVCYARPLYTGFINVGYINCDGDPATEAIPNDSCKIICMLQSSPGTPVSFTGGVFVTINYLGLC